MSLSDAYCQARSVIDKLDKIGGKPERIIPAFNMNRKSTVIQRAANELNTGDGRCS